MRTRKPLAAARKCGSFSLKEGTNLQHSKGKEVPITQDRARPNPSRRKKL